MSYHILNYSRHSGGEHVLGVYIEGDKKFSLYKKGADGDEKLTCLPGVSRNGNKMG